MMTTVIVIISIIIGWIYSVKVKDWFDGFKNGVKQMLIPVCYIMVVEVAAVAFTGVSGGSNIFFTIINAFISMTETFNVFVVSILSAIGGVLNVDFANVAGQLVPILGAKYTDANLYPLITIISQSMYGLVMFIAPTSMLLVAGLTYLDVSYKDWIKYKI